MGCSPSMPAPYTLPWRHNRPYAPSDQGLIKRPNETLLLLYQVHIPAAGLSLARIPKDHWPGHDNHHADPEQPAKPLIPLGQQAPKITCHSRARKSQPRGAITSTQETSARLLSCLGATPEHGGDNLIRMRSVVQVHLGPPRNPCI